MLRQGQTRFRWSIALGLAVLLLGALLNRAVDAAPAPRPVGQTVPLPTATPTQPPPPTATPRAVDDDDDRDDAETESGETGEGAVELPASPTQEAVSAPGGQTTGLQGLVDVTTLNVREGPSVDFPIAGKFVEGDVVELLERTENGNWYLICCLTDAGTGSGWANAQFLVPLGMSRQEANRRLARPVSASTAAAGTTTVPLTASPALTMTIEQLSPFVVQGGTVELLYTILNPGEADALDVTLHNDLPVGLFYVGAQTGGTLQDEDGAISVAWDSLPASQTVTVTLTLEIQGDLADGATIDNVASADAANAGSASGGVSIGLPPADLPTFQ